MTRKTAMIVAVVLAAIMLLLQREFVRGTFDPVERNFVGWLSANTGGKASLPPLTLVLYDEEALNIAGAPRMGALDAALFARAVSKLGAVAAGIEGLPGDPARMMEAAGRLRIFAGYAPESPPGTGWTPWRGVPGARWMEVPGLLGPESTRLPRGFFALPEGDAGPCFVTMAGKNSGRVVPSFLALAWSAAQQSLSENSFADGDRLGSPERWPPLDSQGRTAYFRVSPPDVLSMNELLVAAENHERGEARSPLRGHIAILARATADVARLRNGRQSEETTPSELWAEAWSALRQGRSFVLPGWWYQAALVIAGTGLAAAVAGRGWFAWAGTLFAALLGYLLCALGAFASSGLLLPFLPSAGTLTAGALLARWINRT